MGTSLHASHRRAFFSELHGRTLVHGERRAAHGGVFLKHLPANGRVMAEVVRGAAEEISTAVESARWAFDDGRWWDAERKTTWLRIDAAKD
jgi:acyl-CoA reductase-like NAD-dependent aldehyde dehydrogenase